tara:strand:+ start:7287 stop:8432 length:1146 start_codon:yes stop_codon:yes gene_type:complete
MISLVNNTIDEQDIAKLCDWLKTNPRLTKGPLTVEYEKKWAKWLGTKYAVFVNSGSSANLLMLHALLEQGELRNNKVVIPNLCWVTDLAPALQLDYQPILCDCNLSNLSLDLRRLEEIFIEEDPAVVLLVSVLGFSPDMQAIGNLCEKYNVILLEDCCESMGTQYKERNLGTFGAMSSFSTYFGHHISTIEGGMVCTDDKDLYDILVSTRSHGWSRDWDAKKQKEAQAQYGISDFNNLYTFYYVGMNVRSTDLQAFIGINQLDKLEECFTNRNRNFKLYEEKLDHRRWRVSETPNSFTSNFAYPIIHPRRDLMVEKLVEAEVEVRPLICGGMNKQPFYFDPHCKEFPNCDLVYDQGFYIPNNPSITEDELTSVCDIINEFI